MDSLFIYAASNCADFDRAIVSILERIPSACGGCRPLRLTFFDRVESGADFLLRRSALTALMCGYFGAEVPVWSYISQAPLGGVVAAEVWFAEDEALWQKERAEVDGVGYLRLVRGQQRRIMAGGISFYGAAGCGSIYEQSSAVCGVIAAILEREQMPLDSIVRQWNYIENIVYEGAASQNYQEFNDARSEFYGRAEWSNGYPAATGIGTKSGGITVDFDAAVGCEVIPIDNALQVAAHAYSKQLLIGERSQKSTPKFERAKLCDGLLYISGTAAIRGEESLRGISAGEQARITLENIEQLLREAKSTAARSLRVYVKNGEELAAIREVVESYAPHGALYLLADVCRSELLVEIEGIA